jgi:Tol biopolymer transport system component
VLGRGLFVRLLDSQVLLGAGRGSNPAWFPDSQRLVFNVSEDDGARLTGSELVLLDCRTGNQGKLTDTPDFKEMHPTVSYDGKHLAFVSDLDLYVAKIVE